MQTYTAGTNRILRQTCGATAPRFGNRAEEIGACPAVNCLMSVAANGCAGMLSDHMANGRSGRTACSQMSKFDLLLLSLQLKIHGLHFVASLPLIS